MVCARIGQSADGTHDQYADEQLATVQKRIFLIEFLPLRLVIVYQGLVRIPESKKIKNQEFESLFMKNYVLFNTFELLIIRKKHSLGYRLRGNLGDFAALRLQNLLLIELIKSLASQGCERNIKNLSKRQVYKIHVILIINTTTMIIKRSTRQQQLVLCYPFHYEIDI